MNILEIKEKLPHAYPFLMVDRISEDEKGVYGLKNVTINEPFFQGHFPGNPIMPGVLIIEAMAQTAGLISFKEEKGGKTLLLGIDKTRFKKQVIPGDAIKMYPKVLWKRECYASVEVKVEVEGQLVAKAQLLVAVLQEENK